MNCKLILKSLVVIGKILKNLLVVFGLWFLCLVRNCENGERSRGLREIFILVDVMLIDVVLVWGKCGWID